MISFSQTEERHSQFFVSVELKQMALAADFSDNTECVFGLRQRQK